MAPSFLLLKHTCSTVSPTTTTRHKTRLKLSRLLPTPPLVSLSVLFNLNIYFCHCLLRSFTDYCCLAKEIESELQAGKINKKRSSKNKGKNWTTGAAGSWQMWSERGRRLWTLDKMVCSLCPGRPALSHCSGHKVISVRWTWFARRAQRAPVVAVAILLCSTL